MDKENVDIFVASSSSHMSSSSSTSSSSSAGTQPSSGAASTATSGSSSGPSLGSKLLQKAGRLVGVGGSSDADESGGKKPAAAASYSPWDRYRPSGLRLLINDAVPCTEEGPVLEAIFLGLARRLPPSELWGTTHVVSWSLAEKTDSVAATAKVRSYINQSRLTRLRVGSCRPC